jgi:hypothetical protein
MKSVSTPSSQSKAVKRHLRWLRVALKILSQYICRVKTLGLSQDALCSLVNKAVDVKTESSLVNCYSTQTALWRRGKLVTLYLQSLVYRIISRLLFSLRKVTKLTYRHENLHSKNAEGTCDLPAFVGITMCYSGLVWVSFTRIVVIFFRLRPHPYNVLSMFSLLWHR